MIFCFRSYEIAINLFYLYMQLTLANQPKSIFLQIIKKYLGSFNKAIYFGSLNAVIINPPINPRFISTALCWKGNK